MKNVLLSLMTFAQRNVVDIPEPNVLTIYKHQKQKKNKNSPREKEKEKIENPERN